MIGPDNWVIPLWLKIGKQSTNNIALRRVTYEEKWVATQGRQGGPQRV
jgi:hypothetical protein